MKHVIRICLGSSCFSRGNGKTLEVIQKYIKEKGFEAETDFKGMLCHGLCDKGPIVSIDDKIYEEVDSNGIIEILNDIYGG